VKDRKEQQERTEKCKGEITKSIGKRKYAMRKGLNEAMKRKNTQAD